MKQYSNLNYSFVVKDKCDDNLNYPVFFKVTTQEGIILMQVVILAFDTLQKAEEFCMLAIHEPLFSYQIIHKETNVEALKSLQSLINQKEEENDPK